MLHGQRPTEKGAHLSRPNGGDVSEQGTKASRLRSILRTYASVLHEKNGLTLFLGEGLLDLARVGNDWWGNLPRVMWHDGGNRIPPQKNAAMLTNVNRSDRQVTQ